MIMRMTEAPFRRPDACRSRPHMPADAARIRPASTASSRRSLTESIIFYK